MRIGVLGGTGVAGSAAVAELRARGHDVVVLSRSEGFDVTAPAAGAHALDGVDALVDCLNPSKTTTGAARAVLVDGLRETLKVAAAHGVGHLVSLSIVGIEHLPFGYYRVKVEQEQVVAEGPLTGTVVRATQFPELFDLAWGATRPMGVIPAPRGAVAPIDPADVAVLLADLVEAGPAGAPKRATIRGAETVDLRQVARDWKRVRGSRRPIAPIPALGAALRAVASGLLVDPEAPAAPRGWSDWLERQERGADEGHAREPVA